MRLGFTLTGVSPLIQHNGAGAVDARSDLSIQIAEIAAKKGTNRTAVDDRQLRGLECRRSLYLDGDGKPAIAEAAIRSLIETAARKTKQGPQVREGLLIESAKFHYDVERYGKTLDQLAETIAREPGQEQRVGLGHPLAQAAERLPRRLRGVGEHHACRWPRESKAADALDRTRSSSDSSG